MHSLIDFPSKKVISYVITYNSMLFHANRDISIHVKHTIVINGMSWFFHNNNSQRDNEFYSPPERSEISYALIKYINIRHKASIHILFDIIFSIEIIT